MLIELIDSGPRNESPWFKEKANGWTWRLHWYRTEPPEPQTTYRVDVLDERGTTLIYSEESTQPDHTYASGWAAYTFTMVLTAHNRLPKMGCFCGPDDAKEYRDRLAKYRRE